jgi:hypothetical protein
MSASSVYIETALVRTFYRLADAAWHMRILRKGEDSAAILPILNIHEPLRRGGFGRRDATQR